MADNVEVAGGARAGRDTPEAVGDTSAERDLRPATYVDPRVAEGSARASLDRMVDPDMAHRSLRRAKTTFGPLVANMRNVSRREFRRHVERRIIPMLTKQRVYSRLVETPVALELRSLTVYGNSTDGMRSLEHVSSNVLPVPRIVEIALIRPHAVARCMQRNGVTDRGAIRREIAAAMVLCSHLAPLATAEQWKQVAVPTENGVFLGFVDDDGLLVLCTYIRPGQNDRESRWDALLREFGPVPMESVLSLGREAVEFCESLMERLTAPGPLSERFPALRQPYRPRQDALEIRWSAARTASLA
jgi:hypothetical protein